MILFSQALLRVPKHCNFGLTHVPSNVFYFVLRVTNSRDVRLHGFRRSSILTPRVSVNSNYFHVILRFVTLPF